MSTTTILGCGRWGSFLAWYSHRAGHRTCLWGRPESRDRQSLLQTRCNAYLALSPDIHILDDLSIAIESSSTILIAIRAQELRSLCRQLNALPLSGKTFVLCMKGLEADTGKRLTQIFREEIHQAISLAVWLGPGHVQEFTRGVPNCMVIGSDSMETTRQLVEQFSSDLIRFYFAQDLIGNEIGAASKNVMGIAAGMLDGLGLSSLKGALIARGAREISRLVRAMGGNELTPYGLCHLGDYEATLFSAHSQNRRFGEACILKEHYEKLAEGAPTSQSLEILSSQHEVDLPISQAIAAILYKNRDPQQMLRDLFLRATKAEF